ncbi:M23 family metallopeptidase [Patescibacteria group bacterium]|nr:M23 family metallopeptidase [Patescibacteria group bacterium]
MKKISIILAIILVALMTFWFLSKKSEAPTVENPSLESGDTNLEPISLAEESAREITISDVPLPNPEKRITKKPFGILISPQNSPVSLEKFSGYHTGTDFEIFPEETDVDIEVRAICGGEILQKKKVSGYGGVIIQSCVLNGEVVMVLYGHLKLSNAPAEIGKTFFRGDKLAMLGADGSADTDGERKHLHLGIRKGDTVDVRGYVSNQNELTNWLDPVKILFPPSL